MTFGLGIVIVGILAIVVGFLPASWRGAVQGAGDRRLQLVGGALTIVVGAVVHVMDL